MILSRKHVIAIVVAGLLAAAAAAWLYIGSTSIVVREGRVNLPHWAAADDGFSVAVLSDLHFGPGDAERAAEIARCVNKLHPKLIVLLGDFINGSPDHRRSLEMAELTEFIRSLRAECGVFAVTGNHELWYDRSLVTAALERGGARVLGGKTAVVRTPSGGRLQLVGMPDYTSEKPWSFRKAPGIDSGAPTLILMHDPHSVRNVPENFGLGLAGHTHGGQLRLPGGGNGVSLNHLATRIKARLGMLPEGERPVILFDRGFTLFRNRRLFITSGVGGDKIRLRTFCPPEIVRLKIYASDPEAAINTFVRPLEI